jgi:hypothetical protein
MTRYLVNPLALFLAVWAIVVALYLGGVSAGTFPPPEPVLWVAVLLSVGGFSLGYLTWSAFLPSARLARPALPHTKVLTTERIVRALRLTGLMGLMALALALYRINLIAAGLGTSVRALLSDPALLRIGFAGFVTAGVLQANWIVMLNSITSALFSTGFILLGILLYIDTKPRKYFYLFGFLLVCLATGLTSVSRYEATVNILYLVFAYSFMHARSSSGGSGKAEGPSASYACRCHPSSGQIRSPSPCLVRRAAGPGGHRGAVPGHRPSAA